MGDDLTLPERDCARTPMQWSTEPHGGFTKTRQADAAGDQRTAPTAIEHVNVAEQRRDPNSLLNWTERIIRMRKEVPEIGWGDFAVLPIARSGRARACATTGATTAVLFVHNFDAEPREIAFRRRPRAMPSTATCWSIC